jgi:hypothetical protein
MSRRYLPRRRAVAATGRSTSRTSPARCRQARRRSHSRGYARDDAPADVGDADLGGYSRHDAPARASRRQPGAGARPAALEAGPAGGRLKIYYNGVLKADVAASGAGNYFKAGCYRVVGQCSDL